MNINRIDADEVNEIYNVIWTCPDCGEQNVDQTDYPTKTDILTCFCGEKTEVSWDFD